MSSWMVHRDQKIFPDPDRFQPERWTDPADLKRLDPYLVSFGKGSRQCLGMPYVTFPVTFPPIQQFFPPLRIADRK